MLERGQGFEVVDYDFILNTIQVYETGPHFYKFHFFESFHFLLVKSELERTGG